MNRYALVLAAALAVSGCCGPVLAASPPGIADTSMAAALVTMGVSATDAVANWREKYKVLKIGSVTVETQAATITRFKREQ